MKTGTKVVVTISVIALFIMFFTITMYVLAEGFSSTDTSSLFQTRVMVIPLKGMITFGGCGGGLFSGAMQCAQVPFIKQQLKEAEKDSNIGAVILEINSGGGAVVASRELMKAVKDFEKPIVVWIGESGASGAFYVASAADYIMADRDSVTGSIGVIMNVPHYYGFMDEWGFNMTVIKAGESKDIGSPYRPMKVDEQQELQDMVDKIYEGFVSDVAENRGLEYGYVENLSRGQIFLGSEAAENGLIDEVGGRDDAIKKAAELAGIKGEPEIRETQESAGLLDILFNAP